MSLEWGRGMCCGFWEIKVSSLLQKLEKEILTFLVDGRVLAGDVGSGALILLSHTRRATEG